MVVIKLTNSLKKSEKFDAHIRTTLTRRHTKETLGNPDTYTILQPSTDFDFLDENCMYYDIEFRIVRIRLDNGTYICIATNLSGEEFPLEEINKLYRMRWSEETSFRELKYTIGLINILSTSVQREIGISCIGLHKSRHHYTAL